MIAVPDLPPGYSPGEALATLRRAHWVVVKGYGWATPRAQRLRSALASCDPVEVTAALAAEPSR